MMVRNLCEREADLPLARPRLRPASSSDYQGRVGAASLERSGLAYAGPKFVEVKVRAIPRVKRAWSLDLCVHLQFVQESSNFTRSSVPLIESLKTEKLDSFAINFAFQGF